MLVDNKFLYISLPRCASTSFLVSCVKNNINLKHIDDNVDTQISLIDKQLDAEELASTLTHPHECCNALLHEFGNKYDIIAVKRNRHKRFISCWGHILHEILNYDEKDIYEKLKLFNEEQLLEHTSENLNSIESTYEYVYYFLNKHNIIACNESSQKYISNMLRIQFWPMSSWHNNNPNIIWFDFEKLYELENWVSNKLEKPFKLEKTNSSKFIETNLKLTDNFIKKYNEIYDIYDFPKSKKTLL